MEHAIRVSQGSGRIDTCCLWWRALQIAAQQRRALFNDLQRLTPLLRRLMGDEADGDSL